MAAWILLRFRLRFVIRNWMDGCSTITIIAIRLPTASSASTKALSYPAAGFTSSRRRGSPESSCTASSPADSIRCPVTRKSTRRGRSWSRSSKRCWRGAGGLRCNTPRATPLCTSPWSMPGRLNWFARMGKEIVSSADLVSLFEAVLTEAQIATHYAAQQKLDEVLRAGWKPHRRSRPQGWHRRAQHGRFLAGGHRARRSLDRSWPQCLGRRELGGLALRAYGCRPQADSLGRLCADRYLGEARACPQAIWYDITWTGVVDREPTEREQRVFEIVRECSRASIAVVKDALLRGADCRLGGGRCFSRGDPAGWLRRVVYASDGTQYRHGAAWEWSEPRQPGDAR